MKGNLSNHNGHSQNAAKANFENLQIKKIFKHDTRPFKTMKKEPI